MTAIATQARRPGAASLWSYAAAIFANAGRTYNLGNGLALVAAATAVASSGDVVVGLGQAFVGSAPAIAMSLGSLTFFSSGAAYDHAYRAPASPDDRSLRMGHALAAIGSAAMAFGVAELANTRVAYDAAIASGALSVVGKLAAACGGRSGIWALLPLLSRAPALVSLMADVAVDPRPTHMAGAALLAVCTAIWARADAMLLAERHARWIAGALGLSRSPR